MSSPRSVVVVLALVLALAAVGVTGCSNDATSDDAASTTVAGQGGPVSARLETVVADANRMAPELESKLRGTDYPTDLDGAREALARFGIATTPPNAVGGYEYEAEQVEFRLCIEGSSGAYAVYDTRPMSLLETGESGGCPGKG